MKPFAFSLLAVVVLFALLLRYPPTTHVEAVVVGVMALTYLLGWGQMVVFRRHWPLRSLGIFWTFVADSVFWGGTLAVYLFHRSAHWIVALIVAAFLVGGPLFDLGVVAYIRQQRQEGTE